MRNSTYTVLLTMNNVLTGKRRIDYEDNIQIKDSMDLAKDFLNEVK